MDHTSITLRAQGERGGVGGAAIGEGRQGSERAQPIEVEPGDLVEQVVAQRDDLSLLA